jgi:hypothetical protein
MTKAINPKEACLFNDCQLLNTPIYESIYQNIKSNSNFWRAIHELPYVSIPVLEPNTNRSFPPNFDARRLTIDSRPCRAIYASSVGTDGGAEMVSLIFTRLYFNKYYGCEYDAYKAFEYDYDAYQEYKRKAYKRADKLMGLNIEEK